jgi:hypothetical protein
MSFTLVDFFYYDATFAELWVIENIYLSKFLLRLFKLDISSMWLLDCEMINCRYSSTMKNYKLLKRDTCYCQF